MPIPIREKTLNIPYLQIYGANSAAPTDKRQPKPAVFLKISFLEIVLATIFTGIGSASTLPLFSLDK